MLEKRRQWCQYCEVDFIVHLPRFTNLQYLLVCPVCGFGHFRAFEAGECVSEIDEGGGGSPEPRVVKGYICGADTAGREV